MQRLVSHSVQRLSCCGGGQRNVSLLRVSILVFVSVFLPLITRHGNWMTYAVRLYTIVKPFVRTCVTFCTEALIVSLSSRFGSPASDHASWKLDDLRYASLHLCQTVTVSHSVS